MTPSIPIPDTNEDLVARLRAWPGDGQALREEAAAALERDRAAIVSLTGERDEAETSGHRDDIAGGAIKYMCAVCEQEESEYSCHSLEDTVIVGGRVLCKQHASGLANAPQYKMPNIALRIRRQRMAISGHIKRAEAAEALVASLQAALEPFAKYVEDVRIDLDNNGDPLPDDGGVGWVYLTVGDFRRARSALNPDAPA